MAHGALAKAGKLTLGKAWQRLQGPEEVTEGIKT